jgi:tRNA wybutosine-synthesizing protein 1
VASDHNHWKAVVEKSYLDGLGIDWSNIRNVMDMRAVFGGYNKSPFLILNTK